MAGAWPAGVFIGDTQTAVLRRAVVDDLVADDNRADLIYEKDRLLAPPPPGAESTPQQKPARGVDYYLGRAGRAASEAESAEPPR